MEIGSSLLVLLVAAGALALLVFFLRRLKMGEEVALRPLKGYEALQTQSGRAIESGRRVHFAMGRASLIGPANPTSIAALHALDHLAEDSCASGMPPLVSVNEGTLLPAAQDSLRDAYNQAGRPADFSLGAAQFVAAETFPMTYAAGVTDLIQNEGVGGNVVMGRLGGELAIITEAAGRADMDQVIGSDDPLALAVASSVTDNLLIGEEMLAAGAYLQEEPAQIASLQVQDVLRLVITLAILLFALVHFLFG